ncbi:MAG TPA: AMP-binding protein [Bacillota bacterium]|nr:AMP-binding protein [Bacillota bacterium]HOK69512.1 AMP-binding protein [Bacillota bacterium]HPP85591.1 AMP-binding protein [Bacillota bacterium]
MKRNKPVYYEVTKFSSIREMLEIARKEAGNDIAFKYKNGDGAIVGVTYNEFVEQTEQLGAALTELGFGSSHIACIGPNSYKWVVTYLTVLKSAGVFVPIDKELPARDILNIVNNSDSEVVFCARKYADMFKENADKIPNVKLFVCFEYAEDVADGIAIRSFDKLLEYGRGLDKAKYQSLKSDPNQLKMLVYTSGTTGNQKGVMLSEHNLVSSVYYGLQVSTVYDTCLSVLPYHHTYEAVSGLLVSLHKHSTICINDSMALVAKNLKLYRPSYVYLVPAFVEVFYANILKQIDESGKAKQFEMIVKLSNRLRKVGIDLRKVFFKKIHEGFGGRLKKIVCGGAPLRPELGDFFDAIGINLINGYGITECSPLVSANNDYFNDCRTVGIKLPCIDLRIDSPNEDGIGEVCVKGDVVMLGYYKQPELTTEVLKDGWFYTGDYGCLNDKGQLLITGRKKNIIVLSNGKNVYPEEIENYIQRIPYVSEVIVKSAKDETGQESRLQAEVFLSEPKSEKEVLNDIIEVCRVLPAYKRVSSVVIRNEEFPKTTSRKIKRASVSSNPA